MRQGSFDFVLALGGAAGHGIATPGAAEVGVKFYAAYPMMSPPTGVLHWMGRT